MKTLVLCVDRDDDVGVKTGIKGPFVGRDDNLAAATKLGLADPEDSDVNAILAAISLHDDLVRKGIDVEIATICGDVRVGSASDLVLVQQLDQVLEEVRPDRAFLVADGGGGGRARPAPPAPPRPGGAPPVVVLPGCAGDEEPQDPPEDPRPPRGRPARLRDRLLLLPPRRVGPR